VVGGEVGGRQQPLALAPEPGLATVGVPVEGQPDEPAVVAVGPAVVRAAEVRGVAHLGPADLHAAVQAHVEVRPDLARLVAGDDEGVLQHPADDVVAGPGDLGLVADEDPRVGEHPLLLELEDLAVVVDVRGDHPAPDGGEDVGLLGHRACSQRSRFSV